MVQVVSRDHCSFLYFYSYAAAAGDALRGPGCVGTLICSARQLSNSSCVPLGDWKPNIFHGSNLPAMYFLDMMTCSVTCRDRGSPHCMSCSPSLVLPTIWPGVSVCWLVIRATTCWTPSGKPSNCI